MRTMAYNKFLYLVAAPVVDILYFELLAFASSPRRGKSTPN